MDTELERGMGLMEDYNYTAMTEGECWVAQEVAERMKL
jgi:hypothetical protein